jgi:hypothetical protein
MGTMNVHIAVHVINVRGGEIYYAGNGTTNIWVEEKRLAFRYTSSEAKAIITALWDQAERQISPYYTVEAED